MDHTSGITDPFDTLHALQRVRDKLKERFIEREPVVDLLLLATVCRENALVVGPPGTAKTELVQQYTRLIEASGFHYLLSRFTEPAELFGPLDLERFRLGTYHIRTDGMLPEAEVAFLDEVFQGSSAILNTLLTLLNERIYHNGNVRQPSPLLCMIGATNQLPEDPSLQAFADRFTLRVEVERVAEERLEELLEYGWDQEVTRIRQASEPARAAHELPEVRREDVRALYGLLRKVEIAGILPEYARILRELRAEGVEISDRRVVKGLKLIAGAALLRRSMAAGNEDLWPVLHLWNRPEEAEAIRSVLSQSAAEGTLPGRRCRELEAIQLDWEQLDAELQELRSLTARQAHLAAFGRLRRELIVGYPQNRKALEQVETSIRRALEAWENSHV